MKPIDVIRKLVEDNPNDMMLGEVIRQYIREIEQELTCQYSGLPSAKSYGTKHFAEGFHEGKWEEDEYKAWPGLDNIENDEEVSE
tara:strand:- start:2802 stop:3056 length:255 start_codon:yes stop_codon:yes gene_type:complete